MFESLAGFFDRPAVRVTVIAIDIFLFLFLAFIFGGPFIETLYAPSN